MLLVIHCFALFQQHPLLIIKGISKYLFFHPSLQAYLINILLKVDMHLSAGTHGYFDIGLCASDHSHIQHAIEDQSNKRNGRPKIDVFDSVVAHLDKELEEAVV